MTGNWLKQFWSHLCKNTIINKNYNGHDAFPILGSNGLTCNKNLLSLTKKFARFIISWFYFQGDVCRVVRHFHFTTWPDFGVPDPPQTLVRFVRAFRERVGPDQKPIVVHCRLIFFFSCSDNSLERKIRIFERGDSVTSTILFRGFFLWGIFCSKSFT